MGKNTDESHGTFSIEDIQCQKKSIFHQEKQQINIPQGEVLSLPSWNSSISGTGTLFIHLKTPCRFKAANHLSSEFSFRQLFNLIIRRIRSVWAMDGEYVRFNNFSNMMDKADTIHTIENCLYWKDWTRYSSRQKSSMQLGGLQGTIRYHGELAAFLPFLVMAERLNIGKQTSFGLGEIHFEWTPDEKNSDCTMR